MVYMKQSHYTIIVYLGSANVAAVNGEIIRLKNKAIIKEIFAGYLYTLRVDFQMLLILFYFFILEQ